jgi:hypothetical protein
MYDIISGRRAVSEEIGAKFGFEKVWRKRNMPEITPLDAYLVIKNCLEIRQAGNCDFGRANYALEVLPLVKPAESQST